MAKSKSKSASQSKSSGSNAGSISKGMNRTRPKSNPGAVSPGTTLQKANRVMNPGRDERQKEKKPTAPTTANPGIEPVQPVQAPPVLPRAPDNPASTNNPNLPADRVQAERGSRRSLGAEIRDPQGSALRAAQKYKGQNMSGVYTSYEDILSGRRPVTQQQFNGPRGTRTILGQ